MILRPAIREQIITEIEADPTEPLTLPAWAYGRDGRVIVLVKGLPMDLHRHLHELLVRPLRQGERMFDRSGVEGNVNPYLFAVTIGESPNEMCPNGHLYAGNEAGPNSRGYRCLTCLRDYRRLASAIRNADKTACPAGHEYSPENTLVGADGKRRCRTCRRTKNAEYMRGLRALRKEKK